MSTSPSSSPAALPPAVSQQQQQQTATVHRVPSSSVFFAAAAANRRGGGGGGGGGGGVSSGGTSPTAHQAGLTPANNQQQQQQQRHAAYHFNTSASESGSRRGGASHSHRPSLVGPTGVVGSAAEGALLVAERHGGGGATAGYVTESTDDGGAFPFPRQQPVSPTQQSQGRSYSSNQRHLTQRGGSAGSRKGAGSRKALRNFEGNDGAGAAMGAGGGGAPQHHLATLASGGGAPRLPLSLVLAFECLLVVAAFVALVVTTSLMMDSATRSLVEQSVSGDLSYARARILSTIQNYERTLLTLRQSYISDMSISGGREPCADSGTLSDSQQFFTNAIVTIKKNPLVSYIYHLRRSDTRLHPIEGEPDVVECDVTPEYISVIGADSRTTTDVVEIADLPTLDSLTTEHDPNDYFYEDYVPFALSFTRLTWAPYLYFETVSNVTELYLSAYAPILVSHTYANGSFTTFVPDLEAPEVGSAAGATDPLTGELERPVEAKALAVYGLDVGMSTFITLMRAITPEAGEGGGLAYEGGDLGAAHTSLYDLAGGTLVCTSKADITIFDEDGEMWAAGATPAPDVNAAFHYALSRSDFQLSGGGGGAHDDDDREYYASLDDAVDAPATVRVHYAGDEVISTVTVRTTSGIDFVVVQSTPRDYYFGPVTRLRTVMIIVGVVAAVLVVIVCALVGAAIIVPVRHIAANMQLSAAMKNDKVEPTTSVLAEISFLCGAFDRMNAKLLAARAFMPQAMLIDSSDEATGRDDDRDEDDEDGGYYGGEEGDGGEGGKARGRRYGGDYDDDSSFADDLKGGGDRVLGDDSTFGGGSTASSFAVTARTGDDTASAKHRGRSGAKAVATVGKGGRGGGIAGRFVTDASTVGAASTIVSSSGGGAVSGSPSVPSAPAPPLPSLLTKRVTLLVVNTRGFHDRVSLSSAASILHPTSELTSLLQSLCAQERGVIDSFHGDHFVISFNAARANAQGPLKAARAAAQLMQSGGVVGAGAGGSAGLGWGGGGLNGNANGGGGGGGGGGASTAALTFFSMGASTGRAAVGHLGTSTLKRLSIIGKVYSRAVALERVARLVGERSDRFGGLSDSSVGAPSAISVQCVVDRFVQGDISHSHVLQTLGWLAGRPFEGGGGGGLQASSLATNNNGRSASKNRVQMRRAVLLAQQQQQQQEKANTGIVGNTQQQQQQQRQSTPPAPTVNTLFALRPHPSAIPSQAFAGARQYHRGARSPLAAGVPQFPQQQQQSATAATTADEWLYELENVSGSDPLLVAVNKAMALFSEECCGIIAAHQRERLAKEKEREKHAAGGLGRAASSVASEGHNRQRGQHASPVATVPPSGEGGAVTTEVFVVPSSPHTTAEGLTFAALPPSPAFGGSAIATALPGTVLASESCAVGGGGALSVTAGGTAIIGGANAGPMKALADEAPLSMEALGSVSRVDSVSTFGGGVGSVEVLIAAARARLGAALDAASEALAVPTRSSPVEKQQHQPAVTSTGATAVAGSASNLLSLALDSNTKGANNNTNTNPPMLTSGSASPYFWGHVALHHARMAAEGLNVEYSV